MVGCCGCVFYLIDASSFKDNGSLFPTDAGSISLFDFVWAGLLVMTDTGAMIQAKSELGRFVSFAFGFLGFGTSISHLFSCDAN
jgi:hypothetical protein